MVDASVLLDAVELQLGEQNFQFHVGFEAGKITAIAGPSGSGKSTLLNIISGFEAVDRGRVVIDSVDVTNAMPSERPIASIFQDHNLFAHLDIFTNVALGANPALKLSAAQRQSVIDSLQRVGLAGFERRMPGDLSGGERQRAAIARSLIQNQTIILMDEPFAALDPSLRREMGVLVRDIQVEHNRTIIMVTHSPDEVMRLADQVVFLEGGRVLFSGSFAQFSTYGHVPAIANFLDA